MTFFKISHKGPSRSLRLKMCHGTVPFLPRILKIALVFLNNLFWVNLDFWGWYSVSGSGEVGSQKVISVTYIF